METSLLCRIGFCQFCHDKGYPYYNQKFITHGSHGYHVDFADFSKHDAGFTPHLYKLVSVVNNVVNCKHVCCMDECTIQIQPSGKPNQYNFLILESSWKSLQMLVTDWNALSKFKRDPAFLI